MLLLVAMRVSSCFAWMGFNQCFCLLLTFWVEILELLNDSHKAAASLNEVSVGMVVSRELRSAAVAMKDDMRAEDAIVTDFVAQNLQT